MKHFEEDVVLEEWNLKYRELNQTKGRDFAEYCPVVNKIPWFREKKVNMNSIEIKLLNRLMLGHTYCKYYLSKFNSGSSGFCPSCNTPETAGHLIFKCRALNPKRENFNFFNEYNNLAELLTSKNLKYQELIDFLHDTNLINTL